MRPDPLRLDDIRQYEVSARAHSGFPLSSREFAGEANEQEWKFYVHSTETTVALRARLAMETPDASYVVDAVVRYRSATPFTAEPSVLQDFLNGEAMPTLYPFIREALHEAGRKIRAEAILLGTYDPRASPIIVGADELDPAP
ncbi:hypothetical protein ACFORH_11095 [Amycolatopsis roodepoortensis]|uniref:Uncharacterized protein n=1 Tax=Amycolatopsis roodepoortensis TaxID=700274 RepID=A0ABR9LAL1_9PSEU|nr:hypothetical protein [Amycolatopsis roodepoortensis]MBE1577729.1 hypothetical protein [Amycolatopsis roodepoortensis]